MKNKSLVGSAFENLLKNFLEEKLGCFVIRSAASKSPVDLVALRDSNAILIQCKASKIRKTFQKVVHSNATYKEFEELNVDCDKWLAFYYYPTRTCRIFVFHKNSKSWIHEHDFALIMSKGNVIKINKS